MGNDYNFECFITTLPIVLRRTDKVLKVLPVGQAWLLHKFWLVGMNWHHSLEQNEFLGQNPSKSSQIFRKGKSQTKISNYFNVDSETFFTA